MKDLILFVFSGCIAWIGHFANSVGCLAYSGLLDFSKNGTKFSLLHRLWILLCIFFASVVPIIIFGWNPLNTAEQWGKLGAILGFLFVEMKFKTIIKLSRAFINGYYVP